MFYIFFVFCFFRPPKNMRQPFSGTAERIFMKLLPNDSGENPPNNFLGAKKYTVRAFACRYWCRLLRNNSELVYAGSVLYGGCVKKA